MCRPRSLAGNRGVFGFDLHVHYLDASAALWEGIIQFYRNLGDLLFIGVWFMRKLIVLVGRSYQYFSMTCSKASGRH